jgi:hypothetical protein
MKNLIVKTQVAGVLSMLLFLMSLKMTAQHPAKTDMPAAVDVIEGIKPVDVASAIDHSGGVSTPFTLPGKPGDAFLHDGWKQGVVLMYDGNLIDVEKLRYNMLTQQMQFVQNSDTLAIGNPEEVKMIRIDDMVFVFRDFVQQGMIREGYLELLEDGNCKLFRRWTASYRMVAPETGAETIYITQTCFIAFGDDLAREVSNNNREFIGNFGEYEQEVRRKMRQEKLRIKNPEQLREIIAHYNRISNDH